MMCEKCWADAALRVALLGGAQVDRYRELLEERKDNPCKVSEDDNARFADLGDD